MTKEDLKYGNELEKLISITEKAVKNLKKWIDKSNKKNFGATLVDNNYYFYISEHKDGSGCNIDLSRYYGNTELMTVILDTLESQLATYNRMFDNIGNKAVTVNTIKEDIIRIMKETNSVIKCIKYYRDQTNETLYASKKKVEEILLSNGYTIDAISGNWVKIK